MSARGSRIPAPSPASGGVAWRIAVPLCAAAVFGAVLTARGEMTPVVDASHRHAMPLPAAVTGHRHTTSLPAVVAPYRGHAFQGGRGGRGGAPAGPARTTAPVDLTGTWVSVVTEDWQWRMRTPAKGDYTSVPLSAQGRQMADTWDSSKDGMCEAYGVGGLMRMPGRLRISWQDDNTLKIESDAGQQTRLLHFAPPGGPAPASADAPRTLQGFSVATWVRSQGGFDSFLERGAAAGGSQRWGSLRVVTTNMLPGWLRRNGVPYSQNATITEHFTRFRHPDAGDWFVVTTIVEDPQYLAQPFITSSNFKKEPDDSKFQPKPCRTS